MDSAKKVLPQQRKAAIAQAYKKTCVALARVSKRPNGMHAEDHDCDESDDASDTDFMAAAAAVAEDMPLEVLGVILRALDPVALARAGAVCR